MIASARALRCPHRWILALVSALGLLAASCGSGTNDGGEAQAPATDAPASDAAGHSGGHRSGKANPATGETPPPPPPDGGLDQPAIATVGGMPGVPDPHNLYSEAGAGAGDLLPSVADDAPRVYVPSHGADQVTVIDPTTFEIVDTYHSGGADPQHAVPSWDMSTIWITNNSEQDNSKGTLLPIDAATGQPGEPVAVVDPYNLYFTPDGKSALVVAEALKRLDFRDPKTMEMQYSISVPECEGINHADFSIDGTYAIFTCEFSGRLAKIDLQSREVVGILNLSGGGMPQDVRVSPDGSVFYVAEMESDGVYVIDGHTFTELGFVPTGVGAHGLYPSRDGTKLYVINRGWNFVGGGRDGPGSVSVIDFATRQVEANWPVPDGGSPDMGNLTADGRHLWLGGRYDDEVYVFDTTTGELLARIPVASEPHGLTVWPQPGRYSLGHTGNTR